MLVNTDDRSLSKHLCAGSSMEPLSLRGKHHWHLWQLRPRPAALLQADWNPPLVFSHLHKDASLRAVQRLWRDHVMRVEGSIQGWASTSSHKQEVLGKESSRLFLPILFLGSTQLGRGLQVIEGLREWCSLVREFQCLFGITDNTEILMKR